MTAPLNHLFIQVVKLHFQQARGLFAAVGLSRGQPPVLLLLGAEDGQTQSELSEKLQIRAASMSTILQRMEQAKLVERRSHPSDHRAMQVFLTDLGRQRYQVASSALEQLETAMFADFDDPDRAQFRQFLQRIKDNLEAM